MTTMLLAERVPVAGRVLVVGAGGGLELRAMAEAQTGWHFIGVDPSAAMLRVAATATRAHSDRIALIEGRIEDVPGQKFHGATCLLTCHFIKRENRLETLVQIRQRLKPGAPFVLAHLSFPQEDPERSLWIARHVAYAGSSLEARAVERAREVMATQLTILSPDEDEAMLRAAGFSTPSLIYAGLSFRGWIAYA
nr:class I SAM-dependent methyltransferase [Limoniibacter endophyticus]